MSEGGKDITRRAFVAAAAGTPLLSADFARGGALQKFPRGFLWGTATAGHQVEGNNVNADVWLLEQVKPTLFKEPSGDACDSLNRWNEDLDLVRAFGLNCYRFSVEWSRIEPAEGQFSIAYLDFYKRMIAGCHDRGLKPVVTYNHFTSPRWFAAKGGWENPGAPDLFARYCERVTRHMGDGIGYALTFNEPNLRVNGRWSPKPLPPAVPALIRAMLQAAARDSGSDRFSQMSVGDYAVSLPNVREGHRRARAAIKSARADLPVGLTLALPDDQAVGPDSLIEVKRHEVYGPFLELAKQDDFIGVQTYSRSRIGAKGALPPPEGAELTQTGDEFYPAAIEGSVTYAHAATGRPVLITENGIATEDDRQRARFIPAALASVSRAIANGVPIRGYIHWSLLDNFEWTSGYGPKFGLTAVNRTTFRRTPKPSAHVYANLVKQLSDG
jgi:beta-glucosidase